MNMTMLQVEAALNHCSAHNPPIDNQLQKEPRLLCDIWGKMIYEKAQSIDLDTLDDIHRGALLQWRVY